MIWQIYKEYFKEEIRIISLVKNLNWRQKITVILMLGTIISALVYYVKENNWIFFIVYIIASISSGWYIAFILRKIKESKYGTEKEIYLNKIKRLNKILIEFEISEKEQIDILINQISEKIPSLKISENFFGGMYKVATLILIPLSMLFVKEFASKEEYFGLAVLIAAILILLIVFFFMTKNIVEPILDSQHKNMQEIKSLLEDITITCLSKK